MNLFADQVIDRLVASTQSVSTYLVLAPPLEGFSAYLGQAIGLKPKAPRGDEFLCPKDWP